MSFPRESLEVAGYLFEQAHGRVLAPSEISAVEDAGFLSASPEEVAGTIWSTLATASLPSDYRTSAYWALGKLARKKDKKRFIEALRQEVQTDIRVAYQILVALENMAERVFSRDSVSFDEDELNRRDALAYLSAHK